VNLLLIVACLVAPPWGKGNLRTAKSGGHGRILFRASRKANKIGGAW
jgi:hypothetical protein